MEFDIFRAPRTTASPLNACSTFARFRKTVGRSSNVMTQKYLHRVQTALIAVGVGFSLCPSAHAETLRGRVFLPVSGKPTASVAINVRNGRIQRINISFLPISLPTPWDWLYSNPYTHEGVEGYLSIADIDPHLTATTFVRYSGLRGKKANQRQRERKRFTRQGTRTTFIPKDDSDEIFLGDDLSPHEETFAGNRMERVAMSSKLADGKIVIAFPKPRDNGAWRHPFHLFDLLEVQLTLAPLGGERWQLEFRSSRLESHMDIITVRTLSGAARLRGRAPIDARFYTSSRKSGGR